MSQQDTFERRAKAILDKNQAEMDMKLYLSHFTGYKAVKTRHEKELQELAQKHGVELDLKKWKLNGHWM